MNTVGRYTRCGIPVGIGTDTYPHNMLEEMRAALYLIRVMSKTPYDLRTSDIFTAARLGGAGILGRNDIGQLAVGAKADLFLADLSDPAMRPVRDPLQSLVYVAAERAVRNVFVDGRHMVVNGDVPALDLDAALDTLEAAHRRAEEQFAKLDFAARTHDQGSPYVYRIGRCWRLPKSHPCLRLIIWLSNFMSAARFNARCKACRCRLIVAEPWVWLVHPAAVSPPSGARFFG